MGVVSSHICLAFGSSADCLVTASGHVIGSNCSHALKLTDSYPILNAIVVVDFDGDVVAILVAMVAAVELGVVAIYVGMTLTAEP